MVESPKRLVRRSALVLAAGLLVILVATVHATTAHATPGTTTIEFSAAPEGPFQPDFFFPHVYFTQGWFIGSTSDAQGNHVKALGGPIAATFTPPATGISVDLVPGSSAGVARYTLTARAPDHRVVGTRSMVVAGDPDNPWVTISLETLSRKAASFSLTQEVLQLPPGWNDIGFLVTKITLIR
jgi:hypothetical protein